MATLLSAFFALSLLALRLCADHDFDGVFRTRTRSQWQDVWHREKFARCRETLVSHLYWACEKDIYRITRRNQKRNPESRRKQAETLQYPWVMEKTAKKYLRSKRSYGIRSGSSITAECCRSSGCTWEEYAEYCPINKRYV